MISVIIPIYNEENGIGQVLVKVLQAAEKNWEIIVVDDGSTDASAAEVNEFKKAMLIRHPYNKGYGAALKTGLRNAAGEQVVLLDGDSQHNPEEIKNLLAELKDYDLVVGARPFEFSGKGLLRAAGNYLLRRIAGYMVGQRIADLTSGFRAFRKNRIMEFMHLYPNGFSFSATSTLSCLSAGYNVKFIPIKVNMREEGSKSKISLIRDGAKFFLLILRIITMYNPMKVFFPISFFLFVLGFGYGLLYIIKIRHIPAGSLMLVLSSLIIFFFGLIADQISCLRRESR